MQALLYVLKYLRSTANYRITFGGAEQQTLTRYSDSDFTLDKLNRRLILRNVFMLENRLIS